MRYISGFLAALALVIPARADEQAEGRKILDRAIAALGGADKLTKVDAVTWKSKGKVTAEGMTAEFQDEWTSSGLKRMKWKLDLQIMSQAISGVVVLDGDKGWANAQGRTSDLPKEATTLLGKDLAAMRLAQQLTPLLDKKYQLSPLGELKIGERQAIGLKVTEKDQPDLDLYFDKETSLPLRVEVRLKEPGNSEETTHAFYFEEYKDFDGIKHFTKLTLKRDDKTLIEMKLSEVKREAKLDDSVFAKP